MSNDVVDVTIFGDTRRKILDLQSGEMRDGGPVHPSFAETEQEFSGSEKKGEKE